MARRRIRRPARVAPPGRTNEDVMTTVRREDSRVNSDQYGERVLEALKADGKKLQSHSYYEIVRTLGEGGMGTVFLAQHISEGGISKGVAIKVLKDTADEGAIRRFVEEAQLLAQLTQGTVVELLALESMEVNLPARKDGRTGRFLPPKKSKLYYMVQEYVQGTGLEDTLRQLHENVLLMAPPMVGFILNKTAIALAEAHTLTDDTGRSLGLVHRDISPSNILFNAKAGITKLADFGVAKAFGGGDPEEPRLVGKPRYMSPEQLNGHATTASDIWALGVIGYECLTGFGPYRVFGKTLQEKVANLKAQFAYPLRAPAEILASQEEDARFDVKLLSEIVMRCLSQSPSERPDSLQLNSMLEGEFLYSKGLGPTNKTLAAYLRLLDYAAGKSEIIPPPGYADTDDAKVLCATLWLGDPVEGFVRRTSRAYTQEFVVAVKRREANPCLKAGPSGPFAPK